MRDGSFREDLLVRLNVVNLKIPPLRERPADVIELAEHFIAKYAAANGVPARPLSAEARRTLTVNYWPGNVRELENTMHRAVLMATGIEIGTERDPGARWRRGSISSAARLRLRMPFLPPSRCRGRWSAAPWPKSSATSSWKRSSIAWATAPTRRTCLGISIRTLRNKLNEYSAEGVPVPPPGGGEPRVSGVVASYLIHYFGGSCSLDDHDLDFAGAARDGTRRPFCIPRS